MAKFIVVTKGGIYHCNNYVDAFDYYDSLNTKCKGLYEVGADSTTVYANNITASFYGGREVEDSFLHLVDRMEANKFKEGTK